VTDAGVEQCGSLSLSLREEEEPDPRGYREIQARMLFGDTEIRATAVDVNTGARVHSKVDFMNESNPKYQTKL